MKIQHYKNNNNHYIVDQNISIFDGLVSNKTSIYQIDIKLYKIIGKLSAYLSYIIHINSLT